MGEEENKVVKYAYEVFDKLGWIPVRQKQNWKGNVSYKRKGIADILCCVRGRYVAVECKTDEGTQSDDQKNFEKSIKRANGVYAIVENKAQVHQLIDQINKIF